MKTESKKAIEIIGTLSVVASLLFVGLQLYLDRQIAAAEQYQNRAESRKSDLRTNLESEAYMASRTEQWELGQRPGWWVEELDTYTEQNGLSPSSIVVRQLSAQRSLVHFDNLYYQYEQGLIDEGFWERALIVVNSLLQDPITRAVWLNDVLRPLSDLAEEIVKNEN